MTARKRARRIDTDRLDAEERELRRLEGGDVRLPPAQPAWSTGASPASKVALAALVLFFIMVALMCGEVERAAALRQARRADRMRTRMAFDAFTSDMTDKEFQRYYRIPRARAEGDSRLSPQSFNDLVDAIKPRPEVLARQRASARKSSGGFVEYELRLSMALRYLAGGSWLDIKYLHGVSGTTFWRYLWPTLKAVDRALPEFSLETDVHDLARCRHLASGFARKTDGHIRGAIGALDGIIFKVERPALVSNPEVVNPVKFNCRKGFPGVSCQAVCDAERCISFVSIDHAASVHDSRAFRTALTSKGTLMVDELARSTVMAQCAEPSAARQQQQHSQGQPSILWPSR